MMGKWSVELEPEVDEWLASLSDDEFGTASFYIDLLEERGIELPFPYSSHLRRGGLRELRFHLGRRRERITYFITGRRIILLTVFHKTQRRETAEIDRAERAMHRCKTEQHTAEED